MIQIFAVGDQIIVFVDSQPALIANNEEKSPLAVETLILKDVATPLSVKTTIDNLPKEAHQIDFEEAIERSHSMDQISGQLLRMKLKFLQRNRQTA